MRPNNLVLRTAKGENEVIQNHSLRRTNKQLNTALFLVDGTRTRRELDAVMAVMKLPDDCVSKLQQLGYVECGNEVFRTPQPDVRSMPAVPDRPVTPRSEAYLVAKQGLYEVLQKGAARLAGVGLFNPWKLDRHASGKAHLEMVIDLRFAINRKLGVDAGDDFFDEAQVFIAVCEKEW